MSSPTYSPSKKHVIGSSGAPFYFPVYGDDEEDKPKYLFVYGIFLDASNREWFNMKNPRYDTVPDFVTKGSSIVQAVYAPDQDLALTGLVVEPDPTKWDKLDALEGGYDRIKAITTTGTWCYMYAQKGTGDKDE